MNKKKDYIQKMANLIAARVKFHAPIVYDGDVDFQILDILGVDASLPVFKYEKPLTHEMCNAFIKAQQEVEFNLIATAQPICRKGLYEKLKHFFIIKEEELGYSLLSSINSLNINYKSTSDFSHDLEENYIKVNGEIINLCYHNFYLYKKASSDGVIYEIKEFVLNGKNFILNFTNPYKEKKNIIFEINVVLPRGYYFFKREPKAIKIENLTNRDVGYFNFDAKNAKFSFSTISGVESSTHACVNMRISVNLDSLEQKRFFFNFGPNKYMFSSPKIVEEFFRLSQEKTSEIFDVKIMSRDKGLDDEFNNKLPQKIWLNWLDFKSNLALEERYLKIKNTIIKKINKGWQINENLKGLKQIQIFLNSEYKHVYIVPGAQRYLLADKTKFFNFNLLTEELFKKNNEIYLSFGS